MKIVIVLMISFVLCGCELSLDDNKQRDKAIDECKRQGGTPYVENYDDKQLRPIVHCKFK